MARTQTSYDRQGMVPGHDNKESDVNYMLLIYQSEAGFAKATKADFDQMMAAYGAYTQAMVKAGVLKAGDPLAPSTSATTVRLDGGKQKVLNGPYAETKEQLGGYYIIDVPDLDAAISWAARCPGANGGVMEVRPIGAM
jgi:hypothetical protein